jgi:hypothetical protein
MCYRLVKHCNDSNEFFSQLERGMTDQEYEMFVNDKNYFKNAPNLPSLPKNKPSLDIDVEECIVVEEEKKPHKLSRFRYYWNLYHTESKQN